MRVNLPSNVRLWLYIITALGSPIVAVLTGEANVLPNWVESLWMAEVAAVSAMAALNVSSK